MLAKGKAIKENNNILDSDFQQCTQNCKFGFLANDYIWYDMIVENEMTPFPLS